MKITRIIAVFSLIVAVAAGTSAIGAVQKKDTKVQSGAVCAKKVPTTSQPKKSVSQTKKTKALPRLLELGASKCSPCRMMTPILAELTKEYKGKLKVEFVDVWKDSSVAQKYGIQSIPTQIFFDAKGKEFYRHTGFFAKDDIVKTFKDHKIKLDK